MTRNIHIHLSILLIISFVFFSCGKVSNENDFHVVDDSITVNSKQLENVNKENNKKGEEWSFYSAYYQ